MARKRKNDTDKTTAPAVVHKVSETEKKPTHHLDSMSTSAIIALAESVRQDGATSAIILYFDAEKKPSFVMSDDMSPDQIAYLMLRGQHIFNSYRDSQEDDSFNEEG